MWTRFEILLLFLVEAIGVPVLLSLLLLTYSSISSGNALVINLDDLPDSRLQLYKLGIQRGIGKRISLETSLHKVDTVESAQVRMWAKLARSYDPLACVPALAAPTTRDPRMAPRTLLTHMGSWLSHTLPTASLTSSQGARHVCMHIYPGLYMRMRC